MTIVQAIDAKSGRTTTSKNIMDALSYYFEAAEKMSIADNVKPVRGHNIVRAIDAYAGNDYSRTIVEAIDKYTGKGPSMNIMAAIENLESVEPVPPTPPEPSSRFTWMTGESFTGLTPVSDVITLDTRRHSFLPGETYTTCYLRLENVTSNGENIGNFETEKHDISVDSPVLIEMESPFPYCSFMINETGDTGPRLSLFDENAEGAIQISWDSLTVELE